ncbi:hypothetical protein [Photobacterium kishitanii]|uniref:Uncharacterized protein n=1 Tax=Photobacterium kishitanii TaxID=318456 RepID=A0A2T3KLZ9_9GAMM|nr:hypothetical protein [Photobacterium kishitanii]PSV00697.1 hypothetical protein C9J27_06030 [Photobacterium kishitanii]
MKEFTKYINSIGDRHIIVDIQDFYKKDSEVKLVLAVESPEHSELTKRWEIVFDNVTDVHIYFEFGFEIRRVMNMLIVGNSYISGRITAVTLL